MRTHAQEGLQVLNGTPRTHTQAHALTHVHTTRRSLTWRVKVMGLAPSWCGLPTVCGGEGGGSPGSAAPCIVCVVCACVCVCVCVCVSCGGVRHVLARVLPRWCECQTAPAGQQRNMRTHRW
jgi:hypothetical protein